MLYEIKYTSVSDIGKIGKKSVGFRFSKLWVYLLILTWEGKRQETLCCMVRSCQFIN